MKNSEYFEQKNLENSESISVQTLKTESKSSLYGEIPFFKIIKSSKEEKTFKKESQNTYNFVKLEKMVYNVQHFFKKEIKFPKFDVSLLFLPESCPYLSKILNFSFYKILREKYVKMIENENKKEGVVMELGKCYRFGNVFARFVGTARYKKKSNDSPNEKNQENSIDNHSLSNQNSSIKYQYEKFNFEHCENSLVKPFFSHEKKDEYSQEFPEFECKICKKKEGKKIEICMQCKEQGKAHQKCLFQKYFVEGSFIRFKNTYIEKGFRLRIDPDLICKKCFQACPLDLMSFLQKDLYVSQFKNCNNFLIFQTKSLNEIDNNMNHHGFMYIIPFENNMELNIKIGSKSTCDFRINRNRISENHAKITFIKKKKLKNEDEGTDFGKKKFLLTDTESRYGSYELIEDTEIEIKKKKMRFMCRNVIFELKKKSQSKQNSGVKKDNLVPTKKI